jgi:O-antigen/teichoic acid export membrane protein
VKLLASDAQAGAAGRFVTGVVVARIPLFLFQAVQAALLPKLSALATAGRLGDFRAGLKRIMVVVTALAAAGTVVGAVLGPTIVEIMFPNSDLDSRTMGLLAAGSGLYMLALACAQALIALGGHRDQAIGWGMGVVALAVTTWLASDDLFLRVELGLLVGSLVAFLTMGVLLLRRLAVSGPLAVDRGDLIAAIHEVAIEA